MSADTAEELKAVRQDIKQLNEGMIASFKQIGDTFIAFGDTMASKEDLGKLEARMDGKMAAMEGRIKDDIAKLKESLIDTIKQLWQQRSSE